VKAIRVHRTGGPEALQLDQLPSPQPGPGEARVRVHAAGVNFIDVYFRKGAYPRELPFGLGEEGAGVVEAVGSGVSDVRVGERVAWAAAAGSYATEVIAKADKLVPVPEGVDLDQAAAAMLQGMTAHYLARSTFPLQRGQSCLVHAAAGGVGLLLVQMAKRAGARVFGTTSTEEKAKLAREAGADEVILYTREPFDEAVRRHTGGEGVHVVYDSVGKTTFEQSLRSLKPRGLLALFGQSSGAVPPVDLQVLNARGSLYVTRPSLPHYTQTREELLGRARDVLGAVARGELKLRIQGTFPLERAGDAHRALESRQTSGKLLLVPGA
jgi:NADPH2:quinone reductase